jgi:multimeric flavodoxin WrbA
MAKNLIILGSARKDSNTRTLLKNVFRDIDAELIDLLDYHIAPFDYQGSYPKDDDFPALADKMTEADNIIFATPVYWYAMSGILKHFLDRFTDLITIQKSVGRALKGKRVFLFSVGADPEPPAGFYVPFERTAQYLGMTYVRGMYISARSDSFEGVEKAIELFSDKLSEGSRG